MIRDLTDSYLAGARAWIDMDALPQGFFDGLSLAQQLSAITRLFSKRFGSIGTHFVIEKEERANDHQYYFTLCKSCEWESSWNTIEVQDLIFTARKVSKALHAVLFSFLKLIRTHWSIQSYFGGSMEMAVEWVETRIEENWEYDNPEDCEEGDSEYRSMLDDLNSFRRGPAAHAAAMIMESEDLSVDQILARLKRLKKSHPLINAMISGCELLAQPYDIHYFDNSQCSEDADVYDNGIDALSYWDQNTILWQFDNAVTSAHEEYLNIQYQESGMIGPIAAFRLDAARTDWDRTKFDGCDHWPMALINVFNSLNKAC